MSNDQIIRAWKDEHYRSGLSEAERALLPPHPSGIIALTDPQLNAVSGGFDTDWFGTTTNNKTTVVGTAFFSLAHCKP